ncbi:MAG TPA: hypothetical protein VN922_07060, partial [Bacteroidia bacterium]|nr:hypothetical protein [Bacteroidia bacterium]
SITPHNITTTVSFLGAMTYAELSNYYIPPVHPWLMSALNVTNVQYSDTSTASSNYGDGGTVSAIQTTLINNPTAKAAADAYYQTTLGTGAADPSLLYNFTYGQAAAVDRQSGGLVEGTTGGGMDSNGAETNNYLSTVGNLKIVSRQIEGKEAIRAKFGVNFIDLDPSLYTQNGASYISPILDKSILLEPGASLFLDYQETKDFINESVLEQEISNLKN